jgi:hypothetical protein
MSAIDTPEFRRLALLAAGVDPAKIPPILDTAEWRRMILVAIDAMSGGGNLAEPIISSGGLNALTTAQQAEIKKGSLVITTDGRRFIYKGVGSKTVEESYVELADITPVTSQTFQVQNVSIGSYSNGVNILAGTPLETIFRNMLIQFSAPTLSLSFSAGTPSLVELRETWGTTIFRNYAPNNSPGTNGYNLFRFNPNPVSIDSGSSTVPLSWPIAPAPLLQNTEFRLEVAYQGTGGNPQLDPGVVSASAFVNVGRKSFFGADTQTAAVSNSATVRALVGGAGSSGGTINLGNGSTYTLKIPAGSRRVTIAYPASITDNLLTDGSVRYVEAGNIEVRSSFVETFASGTTRIQVSSAVAGQDLIDYKVYTYLAPSAFGNDATYVITI